MKNLFAAILLLTLTVGCVSETEYGDCIGVMEEKNSELVYKPSVRNIVLGIIFMELIIPPVVVVIDEFQCPVAKKY